MVLLSSQQGHHSEGTAQTERSEQRWARKQHTSQTGFCGHLRPVRELQAQPKGKKKQEKENAQHSSPLLTPPGLNLTILRIVSAVVTQKFF